MELRYKPRRVTCCVIDVRDVTERKDEEAVRSEMRFLRGSVEGNFESLGTKNLPSVKKV